MATVMWVFLGLCLECTKISMALIVIIASFFSLVLKGEKKNVEKNNEQNYD